MLDQSQLSTIRVYVSYRSLHFDERDKDMLFYIGYLNRLAI